MEMNLVLVDSNEELRMDLWNMLSLHRCFRLAAQLDTTEDAVDYVQTHKVDVIFINNQPADPRCTSQGTYIPPLLAREHPDIQVVIYADSRDVAYDACRAQCAGFLLAPFDPLDLQLLVQRLTYIYSLQMVKKETAQRSIMIKTRSGYQLARISDILFIERSNRKNRIVTTNGQEIALLGYTMNQLEEMLDGCGFYRCYQSFIVNLSQVSAVRVDSGAKNYAISFKDYEGEILLSREKYTELLELLKGRYAGIKI